MTPQLQRELPGSKRKGSTLVHLQAAIAVGAVVISCVSASIAALYQMQFSEE